MTTSYTIHKDVRIDRQIQSDIDHIVAEVLSAFGRDRIVAIVLMGGFGRGEGSVVFDEQGVRAFNDYDFVVIEKEYGDLDRSRMNALSKELAQRLEIDFVDLGIWPKRKLHRLRPTIFNYEMKKGHRIVWGDPHVLDGMKEFCGSDIPLSEATELLFNRGAGLLWGALLLFENDGYMQMLEQQRRFLINACNKAIQAIGDAILIWNKCYHYSYQRRLQLISNVECLPFGDLSIREEYRKTLLIKLEPDFSKYASVDLEALWFQTRSLHERYFHFFEEERLDRRIDSWNHYARAIQRYGYCSVKWPVYFKRGVLVFGPPRHWNSRAMLISIIPPRLRLYAALSFLLYSLADWSQIDRSQVRCAAQMLNVAWPGGQDVACWSHVAREFIAVWHG